MEHNDKFAFWAAKQRMHEARANRSWSKSSSSPDTSVVSQSEAPSLARSRTATTSNTTPTRVAREWAARQRASNASSIVSTPSPKSTSSSSEPTQNIAKTEALQNVRSQGSLLKRSHSYAQQRKQKGKPVLRSTSMPAGEAENDHKKRESSPTSVMGNRNFAEDRLVSPIPEGDEEEQVSPIQLPLELEETLKNHFGESFLTASSTDTNVTLARSNSGRVLLHPTCTEHRTRKLSGSPIAFRPAGDSGMAPSAGAAGSHHASSSHQNNTCGGDVNLEGIFPAIFSCGTTLNADLSFLEAFAPTSPKQESNNGTNNNTSAAAPTSKMPDKPTPRDAQKAWKRVTAMLADSYQEQQQQQQRGSGEAASDPKTGETLDYCVHDQWCMGGVPTTTTTSGNDDVHQPKQQAGDMDDDGSFMFTSPPTPVHRMASANHKKNFVSRAHRHARAHRHHQKTQQQEQFLDMPTLS